MTISTSTPSAGCWRWNWAGFHCLAPKWFRTVCGYTLKEARITGDGYGSAPSCSALPKPTVRVARNDAERELTAKNGPKSRTVRTLGGKPNVSEFHSGFV